MLPANLICCEIRGRLALPRFLGDGDRPWIRLLLDASDQYAGRPVRELEERLRTSVPGAPDDKRRLVAHIVLAQARSRIASPLPPPDARAEVFTAAARDPALPAEDILARCAAERRLSSEALQDALFADLPGERIALPPCVVDPGELALRANLLLAQALVARSARVSVSLEGNARAVVRHAALRGLICTVAGRDVHSARLELSGPFALFRRTLLYGRALASLLPVLAWTRRFRLDAECELRGRQVAVTLATGDPIFPAVEPRRFDSRVEELFARDFGRAAPGWTVVREPEPIAAGGHLLFPDFAVHRTSAPEHRWFVEIVGFWTPGYLATKLERLRQARIMNLVLCIDCERSVGDGDLPTGARIVRYKRRIDPAAVLNVIGHGRAPSDSEAPLALAGDPPFEAVVQPGHPPAQTRPGFGRACRQR